jgi:hypothetical protein
MEDKMSTMRMRVNGMQKEDERNRLWSSSCLLIRAYICGRDAVQFGRIDGVGVWGEQANLVVHRQELVVELMEEGDAHPAVGGGKLWI